MQLSAFVDGELPENEAELLLRRMSQDAELRQQVAEYLALGRLLRSEVGLAATDRLHARVAAEIDHRSATTNALSSSGTLPAIRPLAGIAIAATVALVAIFALQRSSIESELPTQSPVQVADDVSPEPSEVVPILDAQLERQRELFRKHAEISSQLVDLRFSEQLEERVGDNDNVDDKDKETTRP